MPQVPTRDLQHHRLRARIQRWSRDRIAGEAAIQVEQNARVGRGIHADQAGARWRRRSGARHDEVHALRVVLRAIRLAGSMQGDDLMAQDVVPGLEVLGDDDAPGVVVRDHLVGDPRARVRAAEQPALADLEPLQRALVDGLAGPVAVRQVVDDGALVGGWPRRPLQGDDAAGFDGGGGLAGGCGFVAEDVGGGEGGGGDEAVVEVERDGPAYDLGGGRDPLHVGVVAGVAA